MAGLNPSDSGRRDGAHDACSRSNRMQWRKTAERYDQTRAEAIAEGKAIGGAPFGYRFKDPTPKGKGQGVVDSRLDVDEDAAPIVRELFERKAGGATWLELTRWLDTVAPKPNGGHWARSTVDRHDRRRTYLGEVRHGEHVKPERARGDRHPRALAAGAERAGRRTPRGTYLLSGLARCAGCGRTLRGSTLGRKPRNGRKAAPPRVYKCPTRECEARATIVVDRLDAEVVRQFFAHLDAFHVRAVDDDRTRLRASGGRALHRRGRDDRGRGPEAPGGDRRPSGQPRGRRGGADRGRGSASRPDRLDRRRRPRRARTARGLADADAGRAPRDPPRRDRRGAGAASAVTHGEASRLRPSLVLFNGEAPAGLDNGRAPLTAWTWDDDPASLLAAA